MVQGVSGGVRYLLVSALMQALRSYGGFMVVWERYPI